MQARISCFFTLLPGTDVRIADMIFTKHDLDAHFVDCRHMAKQNVIICNLHSDREDKYLGPEWISYLTSSIEGIITELVEEQGTQVIVGRTLKRPSNDHPSIAA